MNAKVIKDRIPIFGILIFFILYLYSTTIYSGGSQLDLNSEGYDWINNYWCNLMNDKGMNGKTNPARPFSISAMIILCLSLMSFFIQFANTFSKSKFWSRLIIFNGILSMSFAIFIFTDYHDLMTVLSSIFGLFVVIGIIREIYISNLYIYKYTGLGCILLLGINNYIYYTKHFIEILPFLQKVTFLTVLIWIIGLNSKLIEKKNTAKTKFIK
ncbi:MAG: hypothetical protein V3V14_14175 [Saprospiraceae bacterium]